MKDEIERRESYTAHVLDYFRARPNAWIDVHTLAYIGGFAAWRTRVSDARKTVKEDGGDIEWNGLTRGSAYRYVPRQARPEPVDAAPVNQPGLF